MKAPRSKLRGIFMDSNTFLLEGLVADAKLDSPCFLFTQQAAGN